MDGPELPVGVREERLEGFIECIGTLQCSGHVEARREAITRPLRISGEQLLSSPVRECVQGAGYQGRQGPPTLALAG